VDLSEEVDDPSDPDFRHCRIKEFENERLTRTFTGKVRRSQVARPGAEKDTARWCELYPEKLPKDGGNVTMDLDYVFKNPA
jgi:hypothetical protein